MILLNSGLNGPPCGTPLSVSSYFPATSTPAFRYLWIRDTTLPSFTVLPITSISFEWFTLSKNCSKSRSMQKRLPSLMIAWAHFKAWCAPRWGLKPKLLSLNWGSYSGCSTCAILCCTKRSTTVGMPRGRFLPLSLGISTLRTGLGRYFPSMSDCTNSSLWRSK